MVTKEQLFEKAIGAIPDEDLSFAKLTDDEITKIAYEYSFDQNILNKKLRIRSRSQQILIAHLYLDHILNQIMIDNLPKPDELELDRIGFSQKIQISIAYGLIFHQDKSMLKAVNDLRNAMAHKLEFEISSKQISKLRSSTPKLVNEYAKSRTKTKSSLSLSHLLEAIVLYTEFRRQAIRRQKLLARREGIELAVTMLEVRRVADGIRHTQSRPKLPPDSHL